MAQAADAEVANAVKEVPDDVKAIVMKLPLTDIDENKLKVVDIRYLEDERKAIYGVLSEDVQNADHVLAVECILDSGDEDAKEEDEGKCEKGNQ